MKFLLISSASAVLLGLGAVFAFLPSANGQSATVAPSLTVNQSSDELVKHPTEVVELFTSQGCSSCPPADRFIASLSNSPSTLALSFNVTYWDYLGWKDRFGQRDFTKRQKEYAKSLGVGNVYTPQIVLNGATHDNIFSRDQVMTTSLPQNRPLLALSEQGDSLIASATNNEKLSDFELTIVAYQPGMQTTPVNRGENRNRTLENYNVVSGVYPLNAKHGYTLDTANHDDGMAYVLLAADRKTSKIVSATQISSN